MPFRAIAYVSEASRNLTEQRLQQLVAEAVQFNESADVTGTLLFDGSRFLQYTWKARRRGQGGVHAHSGCKQPQWNRRTEPGQGGSPTVSALADAQRGWMSSRWERSPFPTGPDSCAARRRCSRAPVPWIDYRRFRNRRRKQARVASSNQTGSWHDEGHSRPGCVRPTTRRLCGMVAAAGGSGSVRRGRQPTAALCHTPVDGGDQLFLLSTAPAQDLRAMGGERSGGLPVRGETPARDQP